MSLGQENSGRKDILQIFIEINGVDGYAQSWKPDHLHSRKDQTKSAKNFIG